MLYYNGSLTLRVKPVEAPTHSLSVLSEKSVVSIFVFIDRRDEALVSAGWGLRRTATRPKPVAAPGRLTLKNTAFAGEVEARWGRVGNAHYYEYQLAVTPSSPEPVLFDTLPILANGPTSCFFSGHPVGYYLTLRVRGNGSKGPSPWTETTTIRIN